MKLYHTHHTCNYFSFFFQTSFDYILCNLFSCQGWESVNQLDEKVCERQMELLIEMNVIKGYEQIQFESPNNPSLEYIENTKCIHLLM